MNKNNSLAIVIPYYKIGYFGELLEALSQQTDKNFNVYIGNDASPDSPEKLIERYKDTLNITYKRFETNMGGVSLTRQWERCLEMIGDEEWIWVLPDDDLPSQNSVEAFYKGLKDSERYNVKVFRLSLKFIDSQGHTINEGKHEDPLVEDNLSFYNRLLRGKTSSSLGDNIFHRQSFGQSGGFVEFPKAWGSDHATVLNVTAGGNLYTLQDASLSFRMSGENISSDMTDGVEKLRSRVAFLKWLKSHEGIFPEKPDETFYKFFYWKGEHYVLHEWDFSLSLLKELYRLRKLCFDSSGILPLLKILLQKAGIVRT